MASSIKHDTFHLMAIAALDVGSKRIGVAVSDPEGHFIHPVSVIERRSIKHDLQAVDTLLASREVDRVIIGLPLNMDGSEGRMARAARAFAGRFEEATGLSVEFQDERLSTFEARDRLAPRGESRGRKKHPVDALAAVVILESWFDARERSRRER